jgi:hypothetical protein
MDGYHRGKETGLPAECSRQQREVKEVAARMSGLTRPHRAGPSRLDRKKGTD